MSDLAAMKLTEDDVERDVVSERDATGSELVIP